MRRSTPKIADHVAAELRSLILGNEMQPGTRLPSESELIEQFGASRASVREAIRLLERDRLVSSRPGPGGGNFAERPTREDMSMAPAVYFTVSGATVKEFGDFRMLIEPEIARLAARNATDEQRNELVEAANLPPEASHRSAGGFHDQLALATNNRVIDVAVAFLHPVIDLTMAPTLASSSDVSLTILAHRKIARAVLSGDEDGAAAAMHRHIAAYDTFMCAHGLDGQPVLPPRQWLTASGNPLEPNR